MSIIEQQIEYYQALVREHGITPQALAHRDEETQNERFYRFDRMWENIISPFSVHEIGCGLGHHAQYLADRFPHAVYSGTDIVPEFIEACHTRFPSLAFYNRDIIAHLPEDRYDFVVLSGTFNGRLEATPAQWDHFIRALMLAMYRMCTKGIAVNFLTSYADPEYMKDYLHYQCEGDILDFVVRNISRHVEMDMAGPLYEYTLRIYRPEYMKSLYHTDAFTRYFRGVRDTPRT